MGEEHDEWLKDREAMEAQRHARRERERQFHELNDAVKQEEETNRAAAEEMPRVEEENEDDDDIEQYTDDER